MVNTLHRYIFRELMRVFVLATVALGLIVTLGLVLRPVQEFGVGPEKIIHLLGYFLPITLTFVMPMGALFAGALVYGRFASDNEIDACRASGVSLMTLVYPGLCLAVAVATTNLVLNFYVTPAFVQRAERSIHANLKQILFRNINRSGFYKIPGSQVRIYADRASESQSILEGGIIIRTKEMKTEKVILPDRAKIEIDTHKRFNNVRILAQETYQVEETSQQYFKNLLLTTEFQSLLSDKIKFQKIDRMKEIKRDMMEFNPVRRRGLQMQAQLGTELLAQEIANKITDPSEGYFRLFSEDVIVIFTADECIAGDDYSIELTGSIILREMNKDFPNKMECQYECDKGIIQLERPRIGPELELVLYQAQWERGDGIKGIVPIEARVYKNLTFPDDVVTRLGALSQLGNSDIITSTLKNPPTPYLLGKQTDLLSEMEITANKIVAEIHSRLVFGIGCVTLILTSIALGIVFKGGHLLTAFGASSIPAGILIVCIMAGRDLAKNPSTPVITGIIVMWVGLIVLSVMSVILYRKLTRT